jgi:hypothetical protein
VAKKKERMKGEKKTKGGRRKGRIDEDEGETVGRWDRNRKRWMGRTIKKGREKKLEGEELDKKEKVEEEE